MEFDSDGHRRRSSVNFGEGQNIFAQKYMYGKLTKCPKFYVIFARKMPEIYMIIARKRFFPNFYAPVSYG